MFLLKSSHKEGEPKNVNTDSVQKAHKPVRVVKVTCFMQRRIDMCCKANCMLHLFACCDPYVKTRLFSSFCLSLYDTVLWKSSDSQLKSLEVTFNTFLREIWTCVVLVN